MSVMVALGLCTRFFCVENSTVMVFLVVSKGWGFKKQRLKMVVVVSTIW